MKPIIRGNGSYLKLSRILARALLIAGFLFVLATLPVQAGGPGGFNSAPTNTPLDSWSFSDNTYWTSDYGYAPVSFTNLAFSSIGNGASLVVDTNISAWLKYNVYESDGTTNLIVNSGTVTFWFAPGSWSSTNAGGTGPGEYGRLFEVGSYTTNSSYGWWSVYVDSGGNNLFFSTQTNDLSSNITTYVTAPITWTNNYFHFIALTYSPTNTALYLDGALATNGPGVTVYPGTNVLANGFCIGSDTNGVWQAHGMFNMVQTFGYPLSSNDVQTAFNWYYGYYLINPYNTSYSGSSSSQGPLSSSTNLWLNPISISNNLATLFLMNSIADNLYEIQSKTNLTQTNWQSEGFVLGSELTNWTPASIAQNGRPRLFMRLRSWVSSDGSGIPNWWEQQYFGTNSVDPNAFDSAGDGYTIYQKFQMGLNPNTFYTPAAPQDVTVNYNANNGTGRISWLPSPGPVTGYTIVDSDGTTTNISASATSYTDNVASDQPEDWDLGTIPTTYTVQANYAGGNSTVSAAVPLEAASFAGSIIAGAQGAPVLSVLSMPANTTSIRLTEFDEYLGVPMTNLTVSISSFTNGIGFIPNITPTNNGDAYFWVGQAVGADGSLSAASFLADDFNNYSSEVNNSITSPFYDGRRQLKDNLIFLLRAASATEPVNIYENYTNGYYTVITNPLTYAYSSYYSIDGSAGNYYADFDSTLPFENNYLYKNYVYASTELSSIGKLLTGVQTSISYYPANELSIPPTNVFQFPTSAWTNLPSVLGTNQTRWLAILPLIPLGSSYPVSSLSEGGMQSGPTPYFASMESNEKNYFGLPFITTLAVSNGNVATTLNPGGGAYSQSYLYSETAQPQFSPVEYDFFNPSVLWSPATQTYTYAVVPGSPGFLPTNQSQQFIVGVGSQIQVAGYAKLTVQNGYSGVCGYLGQYFSSAYMVGTNGITTTNTTGVLSPYGSFLATQPGPAALVTMPDPDTGARGTSIVQCVSLVLDKKHDGTMDTSFNGVNATSASSPYTHWCNNNFDRWTPDADDGTNYQDDVQIQGCPYTPNTATPDCNYRDTYGIRVIPDTRDLEDFARLWVCGVTTNLLAALPAGSTVTLNWGDVGSPNTNNPSIDIFQASDADGGMEYLTNETSAANQIDPVQSSYIGRLAPGGSVQLNSSFFSGWAGNHFIWCGVTNGSGSLNLTIADARSNVLAQAVAYIQIVDIKQMYERWTVGDQLSIAPLTNAVSATEGLPVGTSAFQYTPPQDTNTPYILFVHGWNMETWEKDRFSETAFKRLYWQGYQGRFGEFRWPTSYGFTGTFEQLATNPQEKDNFDNSEGFAWLAGTGLLNKLNDLNTQYPGNVYVLAHSMGNVVAGEALRLAGSSQVVKTYVASQAAVSAHTYDPTVSNYSFSRSIPVFGVMINFALGPNTPNIYGNWFAGNYGGGAGKVVNFYNVNDYALSPSSWQLDQLFKPDVLVSAGGALWNYGYSGHTNDPSPWNHFYKTNNVSTTVNFDIVGSLPNRYEVMSHAAQSYTTALGATPGVHQVAANVDLTTLWPPDPTGNNYIEHFWHSAEFRGDYAPMQGYWSDLLGVGVFNLK